MKPEQNPGECARRVIVYEPIANGHHLPYVRLLLERLIEDGIRPTFCTITSVLLSPEFERDVRPLLANIDVWTLPEAVTRSRHLRNGRHLLRLLRESRRCVGGAGTVTVVIPDFDRLLPWWLVARAVMRAQPGLRGAFMRPEELLDKTLRAAVKRRLLRLVIRRRQTRLFAVIGPLTPPDPRFAQAGLTAVWDPILSRSPERIPKAIARERLDLPRDQTLVMVLGTLSARKNVPLIVNCFEHKLLPANCIAVIAGKPDHRRPKAMRQLQEETTGSERVILRLGLLSDPELADYLAAADVLLQLYDNKAGASGMLSHAVEAGVPLVAFGNDYCENAVRRFRLGAVLSRLDEQSLASGILDVISTAPTDSDRRLHAQALGLIHDSRRALGDQLVGDLNRQATFPSGANSLN